MKPNKATKCGVCETPYFEKNNYFYGKQFTVRDLLQEQCYLNKKRQLVNRMILGWGVVCGLGVRWDPNVAQEFVVEKGMALDCCGHEIIICEEQHVRFEKYEEVSRLAREQRGYKAKFVLCLEYDECKTEPVDLPPLGCGDKQERTEYNRVRDGFKLRIKEWDDACPKQPYGHIGCLDRYKDDAMEQQIATRRRCDTETIHEHICSALGQGCPACECCECVVLATINFTGYTANYFGFPDYLVSSPISIEEQAQTAPPQEQEHQYQEAEQRSAQDQQRIVQQEGGEVYRPGGMTVDTCTDRRFVYNNSLLYDLIYCHHGDLPHIVDFSWRRYIQPQREVTWETFVQMMKEGLTVYFDKEMSAESLNRHTFIVSYLLRDSGTGAFVENRIPVRRIQSGRAGTCYTATFLATDRWTKHELDVDDSELIRQTPGVEVGVDIEIKLRGSRIWSQEGKALDGDFLAGKLPTGNGTQGGDFVDWFRVLPPGGRQATAETFKDF
jgi:hypothetical protein